MTKKSVEQLSDDVKAIPIADKLRVAAMLRSKRRLQGHQTFPMDSAGELDDRGEPPQTTETGEQER